MQIEQLQDQWQHLDQKLEQAIKLQSELLRLAVTQPARRRLQLRAIWPALDIAFCLVTLFWIVPFVAAHRPVWFLVGPAAVVAIAAMLLLVDSIRELARVFAIDWTGPVADIQASLAELRIAKIRQFKWVILLAPLVGFCGLMTALQSLLDLLPQRHFIADKLNPWWVATNYAFGVLFILFGHILIRFLAKHFGDQSWWQRALDDITGTTLAEARSDLERWTHLQDETP